MTSGRTGEPIANSREVAKSGNLGRGQVGQCLVYNLELVSLEVSTMLPICLVCCDVVPIPVYSCVQPSLWKPFNPACWPGPTLLYVTVTKQGKAEFSWQLMVL